MIIDAHVHFPEDHPDLLNLLTELDVLALNISFSNLAKPDWRTEANRYQALAQAHPQHYRWCTAFGLPVARGGEPFSPTGFADNAIKQLDADFAAGAAGCKIWKSYGMELTRPDGSPILVDDPVLAPIFEHMASKNYSLLMHIGDPLAAWLPLDHPSPHQRYYREFPDWHMADKAGFPTHAEIIAARDRMVANHPGLTIVGAHLGSLEHDVTEVADRLRRFPNFHVDISARLADMMEQDSEQVRDFFNRYADRILYGTDIVLRVPLADMEEAARTALLDSWRTTYRAYCAYLETTGEVEFRDYRAAGLGLGSEVLDLVYRENARRIYRNL